MSTHTTPSWTTFGSPLALARLLHLADSALPVGGQAHSFGLESQIAEGRVTVATLADYLRDLMLETGPLECAYCRAAHQLADETAPVAFGEAWGALNARLSAWRSARESRQASLALGRRLLVLLAPVEDAPQLAWAQGDLFLQESNAANQAHYVTVFGLVGGLWRVDGAATALAFLQQSMAGLLAASQKLLPIGQSQVTQILWRLQPTLVMVAEAATAGPDALSAFAPLAELASMRHATLRVRLFIS
jgi:urease accessory protein